MCTLRIAERLRGRVLRNFENGVIPCYKTNAFLISKNSTSRSITKEDESVYRRIPVDIDQAYNQFGISDFKYILEGAKFKDKEAEILSCYIEDVLEDLKKQAAEKSIAKTELQKEVRQLQNELKNVEEMFNILRYKEATKVRKEIEVLNNRITIAKSGNNELLDTLEYYASLELNEHINLRKEDVNVLNDFSEKKQMYFTKILNRLRVAAEKDKLETAPQILWAVTTILITLTLSYTIFPSANSSNT